MENNNIYSNILKLFTMEELDGLLKESMNTTEYASTDDYLSNVKFLTLIVKLDGGIITGIFNREERMELMSQYSNYPAYGVISYPSEEVSISYCCLENQPRDRTLDFNRKPILGLENKLANKIADYLDVYCTHLIEGPCAFMFDDNNYESKRLVKVLLDKFDKK